MRYRRWSLTLNNPNIDKNEFLKYCLQWSCKYVVIGFEKGSEKETPHFQIYFELTHQATFDQIKERFPTAHIEDSRSSGINNFNYCTKGNDFVEYGIRPRIKTDYNDMGYMVIEYLNEGKNLLEIMSIDNELVQYIIKNYRSLKDIEVEIFNSKFRYKK